METINNLTTAASNAIWGTQQDPNNPNTTTTGTGTTTSHTTGTSTNPTMSSGQEPLSGQLGNTTAGEPYDKGNLESSTTTPYTTTGNSTSSNAGPHSSNLANKADPRVDSDRGLTGNTGLYSSTSSNPLTTPSSTHNTGVNQTHSTLGGTGVQDGGNATSNPFTTSSSTHNTGVDQTHSTLGGTGVHDGNNTTSSSTHPTGINQTHSTLGSTGVHDGNNTTSNSRPFSEFGGNKPVAGTEKSSIAFSEPGTAPVRGLHPIDGQGSMTGSHSHRGSGAFQNTQDTHDTLHKRDHADNADHTQDRRKSSVGGVGEVGGVTGKGTPGGMPDIVAKDLEKIKTGKGKPPGGSDAELGLDEAHGGPKADTMNTTGTHEHHEEKVSTMDKIKAKLHHHK